MTILKGLIVSLIVLFSSSASWALDITPNGIYSSTYEACMEVRTQKIGSIAEDRWRAGYFKSTEFTELLQLISNQGMKNLLTNLNLETPNSIENFVLTQPIFHKALFDCTNNDKRTREYLISVVHKADLRGKTVAVVGLIAVFRGVSSVGGFLSKWTVGAQKWLAFMGKAVNITMLTSLLTSSTRKKEPSNKIIFDSADEAEVYKRQQQDIDNLNSDLKTVEIKLKECSQCNDREIMEIYRTTLEEAISKRTLSK